MEKRVSISYCVRKRKNCYHYSRKLPLRTDATWAPGSREFLFHSSSKPLVGWWFTRDCWLVRLSRAKSHNHWKIFTKIFSVIYPYATTEFKVFKFIFLSSADYKKKQKCFHMFWEYHMGVYWSFPILIWQMLIVFRIDKHVAQGYAFR